MTTESDGATLSQDEIEKQLVALFASELGLPPERVDAQAPIAGFGVDSVGVASLIGDVERMLGRRVDPALLWQRPSIAGLARHLASAEPQSPRTAPAQETPEMVELRARLQELANEGIEDPFLRSFDGVGGATIEAAGRTLVNFASYNYLGLAGHPAVKDAAMAAIDRFGTSVSASRLSAGERELHRELEAELARFLGAQDALVFVGGHATNVSVIGHLFSPQDLILYDAAMHNSALWGARLSGARCLAFPHGDLFALERLLERERASHRLALVLVESVYSTDGDVPDLPALVELKRKHVAWLMVDEAHAIGVLGARGRGIAEHFAVPASEIDLLMGTLSKALASCGGYVAGSRELVRYLRYTCPGFVFAAGISPANSAAALQALRVLQAEPQRVTALRARAEQFVREARARGLDTGPSRHAAVVPVNVGETRRAIQLSNELFQAGINVQPLVAPAVAPDAARLRFFLSAEHTQAQIQAALDRTVALAAAGVAASAG